MIKDSFLHITALCIVYFTLLLQRTKGCAKHVSSRWLCYRVVGSMRSNWL